MYSTFMVVVMTYCTCTCAYLITDPCSTLNCVTILYLDEVAIAKKTECLDSDCYFSVHHNTFAVVSFPLRV